MEQIYHLAPAGRWHAWPSDQPYVPAEYAADGDPLHRRRCAHDRSRQPLLPCDCGDFVLLVIDPARLTAPLKWEPSGDDLAALFPHIYGPIDRAAVQKVRTVQRAPDGEFLGW